MRLALPICFLVYSALAVAVETGPRQLPPLYRVEVIVFTHAGGAPDARPVGVLEDFSSLTDPLELAAVARERAERTAPATPELPPPYVAVDALSEPMARAWRRLNDSAAYRPLTRRSWYQPAIPNAQTPRVRVYDDHVILTARPEFDADAGNAPENPSLSGVDGDPFLEQRQPAPFYRLDGSIRLRQRQFLHLDIDLSWREPAPLLPGAGTGAADRGWLLHRITQSRTVRRDRLEYFDSAWIGVLALVTRFEQFESRPPEETSEIENDTINGANE